MKRDGHIYLDYAASTPLCPEAFRAMQKALKSTFANPGSVHSFGQEAISLLDTARENVAQKLNVQFRDVIFTSSATEANNLAILGAARAYRKKYPTGGRIIISAVEHDSIRASAHSLVDQGFVVVLTHPNKSGIILARDIASALSPDTFFVSIILGNNETGVIQPVNEISEYIRQAREKNASVYPLLHTDAAQCLQFIDCAPTTTGADLITLSSQKIYGPKGAAALILPEKLRSFISPLIMGGHQEWELRAGTENVAAVAGFSAALSYIYKDREKEAARIANLRAKLWLGIHKIFPSASLNGIPPATGHQPLNASLPHILNVRFPGIPSDALMSSLDMQGVAVSAGAACAMRSPDASPTLLAMGLAESAAKESIRFSLGRPATTKEISRVIQVLKITLKNIR